MHKGIGPGSTIPLPNGGFMTMVYTPNEGTRNRLLLWLAETNPDATSPDPVPGSLDALRIERGEPVPHDLAAAMLRDRVVAAPTIEQLPPNCDGHRVHDAPPFDPLQDDDEGGPAEAPRCSAGGCGED